MTNTTKTTLSTQYESAENQYLGHRMLFTLENQRSYQILCIILSNIVYLKLS
jgi:hypothetical protein